MGRELELLVVREQAAGALVSGMFERLPRYHSFERRKSCARSLELLRESEQAGDHGVKRHAAASSTALTDMDHAAGAGAGRIHCLQNGTSKLLHHPAA